MIFAFGEDGMVTVYDTEADARRDWEGLDVESGAVIFYDASGQWLKPEFTTPNRRQLFGFIVTNGDYVLRAAQRPSEVDDVAVALDEAAGVNPNPHFDSIDALRRHFTQRK